MAREKEGYRDALERVRREAAGEMVTVAEAAKIVYGPDDRNGARKGTAPPTKAHAMPTQQRAAPL